MGKRFDDRAYHVDHIIPLARGEQLGEESLPVVPFLQPLERGCMAV